MYKFTLFIFFIIPSSQCYSQLPKFSETVHVNNKNLYYEMYGEGEPLIFLHGYSLSSKSWHSYVKEYMNEYQVFLIDLTGHGKSDAFSETLSIKSVAKDLSALLNYLKLEKVKAIGFSFGGDVLYQLALIDTVRVRSMITIGAVGTWNVDEFPQYQNVFNYQNKENFPWLEDSHSDSTKIKAIMEQFINYKIALSNEELHKIQSEVLIMIGDNDEGMNFDEIARAKKYLPNSDIWILPDVAHGAHEGETRNEFIQKSKTFLDKSPNIER